MRPEWIASLGSQSLYLVKFICLGFFQFGSNTVPVESVSVSSSSVTVSMSCWATSPCWPTAPLPSFHRWVSGRRAEQTYFTTLCYYVLVTIYWLFAAEPRSGITWGFRRRYWETVHSKTPTPAVLRDRTKVTEVERGAETYDHHH